MSVKLVSANPDYLEHAADPGVSFPFAISLWFNPSALNADMVLASIADNSSENDFHALLFKGSLGTNFVHAISDDAEAISVGGLTTLDTWYHILGIWNSSSDRKIYLNGTNEGSDATAKTIVGLNTLTIGRLGKLTPNNPTQGRVAHFALWNLSTVFTAEERTQLGIVGISPLLIRAEELISYTPMPGVGTDPIVDVVGGFHLTQNGSLTNGEDNPPVIEPVPGQVEPPALSSINVSIVQNFGFGQVVVNNIKVGTPSNSFAMGQVAEHNIKQGSASNSIFLQGAALNNIKLGVAFSSLGLSQIETDNVQFETASNALLFGQPPIKTNIKTLVASNNIFFAGFVGREIDLSVSNSLKFFGFAGNNIKVLSAQTTFAFNPISRGIGDNTFNRTIIQEFLFEQAVKRTILGEAFSSITFGQEVARALEALSELLLQGFVTVSQTKATISDILFGQAVSVSHDRALAVANSCTWNSIVIGVITNSCNLFEFSPNGIIQGRTLSVRANIQLSSASAGIISFRNPEFGNTEDVEPVRIKRRSRGGTIQVVRDPIWPRKITLNMEFTGLTRTKAQELLTFLTNSLGELVTLVDQDNQSWNGIIITPDAGIGDLQGNRNCNYSASLSFVGEPS